LCASRNLIFVVQRRLRQPAALGEGEAQAFCRDGETLVGWISTGTPKTMPSPRMADDVVRIVSDF